MAFVRGFPGHFLDIVSEGRRAVPIFVLGSILGKVNTQIYQQNYPKLSLEKR